MVFNLLFSLSTWLVRSNDLFAHHQLYNGKLTGARQDPLQLAYDQAPKWSGVKMKIGERRKPSVAWGRKKAESL